LCCAGFVSAGIGVAAYELRALRTVELQSVDARFSIRGPLPPPKSVVLVGVDNWTFKALGYAAVQAAWPFPYRHWARVIRRVAAGHPKAIAVNYSFMKSTDPADDRALIRSIAKAGHVVLAVGDANFPFFGGPSALREIGAVQGYSNLLPLADSDGVVRQVPHSVDGMTEFGIVAASVADGRPVDWPGGGAQWIDFAGPPGTVPEYSRWP
jgi:CHASE2 domain-containing sensor protein